MTNSRQKIKKTALVLGGGGSRGAYEIGVWQALLEMGHTFDMVYGTSIGSINGAMIVQNKFNEALTLWKDLDTATVFALESQTELDNALELLHRGGGSLDGLQKIVGKYIDEEAIRNTSIDYGLVTVEFPSMTPHYLTTKDIPHGKIMDYICASASCFPAIQAFIIDGKKFIDGGYADNVPVGMAVKNGATDIVAVNLKSIGLDPRIKLPEGTEIIEISSKWDLGNFMFFKRDNISKIMRFGYLDTFKAYGVYCGGYYTFIQGEFENSEIDVAEKAAKIFALDPEIIYKKSIFLKKLYDAILKHIAANRQYYAHQKRFASFKITDKILERITKLKAETNPMSITLTLAREMAEKKDNQFFWENPAISLIIRDELDAAQYIFKEGLYP